MVEWNDTSFGWFLSASEYTGYNRKLAQLLLPLCGQGGRLCDVGCGMGLVDFELAPYMERIVCVDQNENAVSFINRRAQELSVSNVSGVVADARSFSGCFDAVIALFCGRPDEYAADYLRLAPLLISVVHDGDRGSIGPKEFFSRKGTPLGEINRALKEKQIVFSQFRYALEFGQPLRSLDEARRFVRTNTSDASDDAIERYLSDQLQQTGRKDFPYYLPNERAFGVYVLRREDQTQLL